MRHLGVYLDEVHRREPHEVLVLGELPEVLSDGDGLFLGRQGMADAQPGGEGRGTETTVTTGAKRFGCTSSQSLFIYLTLNHGKKEERGNG